MDSCHVFTAGFDIRTPEGYELMMAEFDRTIGLRRLLAIHLNDSKGSLGSHRDRHEHIGRGKIGLKGFANFMNDPRLADIPMILETPKEDDARGCPWDLINVKTLRKLVRTHSA